MLNLLEEGTTHLNSTQLAEAQERLGAHDRHRRQPRPDHGDADRADAQSRRRRSTCSPTSSATRPSPRPRSSASRQQQLAAHRRRDDPAAGHRRCARCRGLLYGTEPSLRQAVHRHAATRPSVRALTRDELIAFHQAWIRPDNATIFVVGDLPLARARRRCSRRASATGGRRRRARGTKAFTAHVAAPRAAHRPDRPAAIAAVASSSPARCSPAEGTEDLLEPHRRQRGAGRQLPAAHQHGAARAARLVLRRVRQRRSCASTRCPTSSRRRSRPTAPANSIAAAREDSAAAS